MYDLTPSKEDKATLAIAAVVVFLIIFTLGFAFGNYREHNDCFIQNRKKSVCQAYVKCVGSVPRECYRDKGKGK